MVKCSICGKFCKTENTYTPYSTDNSIQIEPMEPKWICQNCKAKELTHND